MNRFKIVSPKKNVHIVEQTGEVWFHSVWWRHHTSKKGRGFFLSVRHALFRVLFLHQFGRHWAQNIGLVDPNRMNVFLFWILAGNGRIWRKSEKRGFLDGQKQANMAIFVGDPQVSLTISRGFIIFFPVRRHMSVMCLSLLTNSVGLTVKELELIPNWSFSLKSYDMKDLTFLHMLCCSVSIIQAYNIGCCWTQLVMRRVCKVNLFTVYLFLPVYRFTLQTLVMRVDRLYASNGGVTQTNRIPESLDSNRAEYQTSSRLTEYQNLWTATWWLVVGVLRQ